MVPNEKEDIGGCGYRQPPLAKYIKTPISRGEACQITSYIVEDELLEDLRDLCGNKKEELLKGWDRRVNKAEGRIDAKLKLAWEEDEEDSV